MPQTRPFHRNYRGIKAGADSRYSEWAYIMDREYAIAPEHYVRAFLLIQNDLGRLFEFIEPADENLSAYSYRTHELLIRACIEIEANFKAILRENTYNPRSKSGKTIPESRWNIQNYRIVNKTHHLSSYRVHVPIWAGSQGTFTPFEQWIAGPELKWYRAYNISKHDRHDHFKFANLENLLNAVAGLVVVLSSQFRTQTFSPASSSLAISGYEYYDGEAALGGFFRIEFPNDWTDDESYDFNWSKLKDESHRFEKIDYDAIT